MLFRDSAAILISANRSWKHACIKHTCENAFVYVLVKTTKIKYYFTANSCLLCFPFIYKWLPHRVLRERDTQNRSYIYNRTGYVRGCVGGNKTIERGMCAKRHRAKTNSEVIARKWMLSPKIPPWATNRRATSSDFSDSHTLPVNHNHYRFERVICLAANQTRDRKSEYLLDLWLTADIVRVFSFINKLAERRALEVQSIYPWVAGWYFWVTTNSMGKAKNEHVLALVNYLLKMKRSRDIKYVNRKISWYKEDFKHTVCISDQSLNSNVFLNKTKENIY